MNKSEAKLSKKKSSVKNILSASAKPLQEQRPDFNKATQNLALSRTFPPLLDQAAFRTCCSHWQLQRVVSYLAQMKP